MELDDFRTALDAWLDEHEAELAPDRTHIDDLDEQMQHLSRVKRAVFDADWMRWGWPERVGGPRRLDASCAPTSARRSPRATWSSPASTR